MIVPNRIIACHHIELQDGCQWCLVYKQHKITACDRCQRHINTDAAYISMGGRRSPQLICVECHVRESGRTIQ